MALMEVAGHAVERFVGRLGRRLAAWLCVAIFALAAVYQATVAISLALEFEFGAVRAHLIIAAFYVVVATIVVTVLWATSRGSAHAQSEAARSQKEIQVASIVEALLLGYSLSRRK
jgi:hypothetical protein